MDIRTYSPRCSLVNAIDFIIQCSRMEHPYQRKIIELRFINAFINVLHFSNDMKLDIRQTALIFLLTMRHSSVTWFTNFNSEFIITPSNISWELAAREIPLPETISGFLELSKIWDFPWLAFKWLFLNQ